MSLKCLTLLILFGFYAQRIIIPDSDIPLKVYPPYRSQYNGFEIRFSFPKHSLTGLAYMQYFGITFPQSVGQDELQLDQGSLKYSCSLTDGTYNYQVTPVQPGRSPVNTLIPGESNTAFCRLDDMSSNVPLKVDKQYTLTIKLTSVKFTLSTVLRNIAFFTSTSNNPDKIIIDSLPVLGTVGLYSDYTTGKWIDISSYIITNTDGPQGNVIYPYNMFSLTVDFKTNSFVTAADHLFTIKYPTDTVTPPTQVVSVAISTTDPLQGILPGTFSLKPLSSNELYIDGITEDLKPGRLFRLIFSGWTALDTNVNSAKALEVELYYKNTYSIVTYITKSAFTVARVPMTLTANHPEYWDIFRNGAWPITFSFQVPSNLKNGGFILIQHTNALSESTAGGNKISFIASTCDFSANPTSIVDSTLSQRPICYPLKLDHTYTGASATTPFNGSGVFFYFKKAITTAQVYYVTIWAFADNCGGLLFDSISTSTSYSIPKFTITVYKTINPLQLNEARFTGQQILGISTATSFLGKCWNNRMQSTSALNPQYFDKTYLQTLTISNNGLQNGKMDNLLYKEIFEWQILTQSSASTCDDNTSSCWASNMTQNVSDEKFLYSPTHQLASGSYLLIKFILNKPSASDMLMNLLPLPVTYITSAFYLHPGRLQVQLPSQWLSVGAGYKTCPEGCYLSWGVANLSNVNSQVSLIKTYDAIQNQPDNSNFIAACADSGKIDQNFTYLPPGPIGPDINGDVNVSRIVSTYTPGTIGTPTPTNKFTFVTDYQVLGADLNKIQFGMLTTCVKWKSSLPNIKSLYTSIDIQIQWRYVPSSQDNVKDYHPEDNLGVPNRSIRLIKLFPEGGVFNDWTKVAGTIPTTNPFINHLAYGYSSTSNGVCLIELDASAIMGLKDDDSNYFALWMMFGMSLEVDYYDCSGIYPAAPISSQVAVYGLPSAMTMSSDNAYINTGNTTIMLPNMMKRYIATQPINTAGWTLVNGNNRSSYLFLMGSSFIFTGVTKEITTSSSPLLIPYYCPYFLGTSGTSSHVIFGRFPTLMGSWISFNNKEYTYTINRYLTYSDPTQSNQMYSVLLPITPQKGYGGTITVASSPFTALMRFEPYTSTVDNILYLFVGTPTPSTTAITCTGHLLFWVSSISSEGKISLSVGYNGTYGLFNPTKQVNFYVWGKLFNSAFFYGQGNASVTSDNMKTGGLSGNSSNIFFTGIKRPSVDYFYNQTILQIETTNKIAYYCASSTVNAYNYVTNYFSPNFVLDFNVPPQPGVNWTTPVFSFKKDETYLNDPAGSLSMTITLPSSVPKGANLVFSSTNNFSLRTVCALVTPSVLSYAVDKECTFSSDNITCPLIFGEQTFNICCYSVKLTSAFVLSSLKVIFPLNTTSTGSSVVSTEIYNASAVINTFSLDLSTPFPVVSSGKISKIQYSSHSQQVGSIGKLIMEVLLPREPVRDMKIAISIDLAGASIPNVIPRCSASFSSGSESANGDLIIDVCFVNVYSLTNTIILFTKNIAYKCGSNFSKTLSIHIWPVEIVDFLYTTRTYNIALSLSTGEAVADNSQTFLITSSIFKSDDFTSIKPLLARQWDYFCYVSAVTPRLPGELADYTFEFDLLTTTGAISKDTLMNEVSIFFPYIYYGSYIPNILCTYSSGLVPCSFSDEGVLNIVLSTGLAIGSKVSVMVLGVPNPGVDADLVFPCTVNYLSYLSPRKVVFAGSGRLTGGLIYTPTTFGGLKFLQPVSYLSTNVPRNLSIHTFRIAFDTANSFTSSSASFSSPYIYIYFPPEYKLYYYTTKPSASIDEYVLTSGIVTKNRTIAASTSISGNRLLLVVSTSFQASILYWEINISNVTNPPDTIQVKSGVSIVMTNSSLGALYKTHQNLKNMAINKTNTDVQVPYFQWQQGFFFDWDNSKRILDFVGSSGLNNYSLSPGRYFQVKIVVRNKSVLLPHATTTITSSDTKFKLLTSLTFSTYTNADLTFYFGCTCSNVLPGVYIVSFSSSNTTAFQPLVPLVVTVTLRPGSISYQNIPTAVVPGGSAWIGLILSEPNFDVLTVSFVADQGNDPSANIQTITIPTGTLSRQKPNQITQIFTMFTIGSNLPMPINLQKYSMKISNICYTTVDSQSVLSIGVQNNPSSFALMKDFPKSFSYSNTDTDGLIKANTLKFTFKSPIAPIYLYCALVCNARDDPLDKDVIVKDYTDSLKQNKNTAVLQFFMSYIQTTEEMYMLFTDLGKSQNMKLKCLATSTESLVSLRNSTNFTLGNFTDDSGNSTALIKTVDYPSTSCGIFPFNSAINTTVKQGMINYCQNIFSTPSFVSNGCITCSDDYAKVFSPGLSLPASDVLVCNLTNGNFTRQSPMVERILGYKESWPSTDYPPLRDLQEPVRQGATNLTICAIANPICEGSILQKDYDLIFSQMIKDLSTSTMISQKVSINESYIDFNNNLSVWIRGDDIPPNMTSFKYNFTNFTYNGVVGWNASNDEPALCYFQVDNTNSSAVPQDLASFKIIKDASRAGSFYVNSTFSTYGNVKTFKSFDFSTNYSIYFMCTRTYPYSRTRSEIITFQLNNAIIYVDTSAQFLGMSLVIYLFFLILLY